VYTETLEQLKQRARDFLNNKEPYESRIFAERRKEKLLIEIIELAYHSGYHDGFYESTRSTA